MRTLHPPHEPQSGAGVSPAPATRGRQARRLPCFRASLLAYSIFCLGCYSQIAFFEELSIGQETAPAAVVQALPASVDLRPAFDKWGLARRVQGKRGTCSVFTVTGALEYAAAIKQGRAERFSVEFLNWGANKVIGEYEDGGFFSDLWKAFDAYGICSEQTLPYRAEFDKALAPGPEVLAEAKTLKTLGLRHHWIKEWNVKTGLTDEHLVAIKRTLSQGWPVCGGFRWPKRKRLAMKDRKGLEARGVRRALRPLRFRCDRSP